MATTRTPLGDAGKVARRRKKLPAVEDLPPQPSEPADWWPRQIGLDSWQLPAVISARDSQSRGQFRQPARLARSVKTDPACYAALLQRIAPHLGLPREILAADDVAGHAARPNGLADRVRAEAEAAFLGDAGALAPETTADIAECLANHGIAVGQNGWSFNRDTGRLDVRLEMWPIEFTQWFEIAPDGGRGLYAFTIEGAYEPIVHGDGRWVVFQLHELEPWTWGALMPIALLFADRAFAVRDRARNAESHGDSKWIGTLPEGVATNSPEGKEMNRQLVQLYSKRRVMTKPFGSNVERNEAMAQNWQIFREIIAANNSDAAKIYLGQELSSSGSSQRLTLAQLYGVRNDIVERDLGAMARGLNTGTIRPWQIRNFQRDDLIRGMAWRIPDPEEDAKRESLATRTKAFNEAIASYRLNGFKIDQATASALGKQFGVMVPELGEAPASAAQTKPGEVPRNANGSDSKPANDTGNDAEAAVAAE